MGSAAHYASGPDFSTSPSPNSNRSASQHGRPHCDLYPLRLRQAPLCQSRPDVSGKSPAFCVSTVSLLNLSSSIKAGHDTIGVHHHSSLQHSSQCLLLLLTSLSSSLLPLQSLQSHRAPSAPSPLEALVSFSVSLAERMAHYKPQAALSLDLSTYVHCS